MRELQLITKRAKVLPGHKAGQHLWRTIANSPEVTHLPQRPLHICDLWKWENSGKQEGCNRQLMQTSRGEQTTTGHPRLNLMQEGGVKNPGFVYGTMKVAIHRSTSLSTAFQLTTLTL